MWFLFPLRLLHISVTLYNTTNYL